VRESVEKKLGKDFLLTHEIQEIDQHIMEEIKSKFKFTNFFFKFHISLKLTLKKLKKKHCKPIHQFIYDPDERGIWPKPHYGADVAALNVKKKNLQQQRMMMTKLIPVLHQLT
jgi:hypothetical protein